MTTVNKFMKKLKERDLKCDLCGNLVEPVRHDEFDKQLIVKFECEGCNFNMIVKINKD